MREGRFGGCPAVVLLPFLDPFLAVVALSTGHSQILPQPGRITPALVEHNEGIMLRGADPSVGASLIDRRPMVLLSSLALYIASCFLPAVLLHTGGYTYGRDMAASWRWYGHESLRGGELLFTGWFGLLLGNFAVLANPALWLSWVLFWFRQNRGATIFSAAALLLAMLTFQLAVRPYYFDEAGARRGYLQTPEIGFFCWLASMALILISSIRARRAASGIQDSGDLVKLN
jgi:hypothetical protein